MSGGWTEDPELVKLRDSGAENAQARQQRVSQAKEELDSFVRRYGAMISGGVAQAADVLRASGKFGNLIIQGPEEWRPHRWELRGEKWGDPTTLLYLSFSYDIQYRGALLFEEDHIYLDAFSEQWFREKLRERIRKLVS